MVVEFCVRSTSVLCICYPCSVIWQQPAAMQERAKSFISIFWSLLASPSPNFTTSAYEKSLDVHNFVSPVFMLPTVLTPRQHWLGQGRQMVQQGCWVHCRRVLSSTHGSSSAAAQAPQAPCLCCACEALPRAGLLASHLITGRRV